jgi:hypothetical protein
MGKIKAVLKAGAAFIGKWSGAGLAWKGIKKVGRYIAILNAAAHGKFGPDPEPEEIDTSGPEEMPTMDFDPAEQVPDFEEKKRREPYLVMAFAKSNDAQERFALTQQMTSKTKTWCFCLSDEQRFEITRAGFNSVRDHLSGQKTIDSLPKREAAMFGHNKGRSRTNPEFGKRDLGPITPNAASKVIAETRGEAFGRMTEWGSAYKAANPPKPSREAQSEAWEHGQRAAQAAVSSPSSSSGGYKPPEERKAA